MTTATTTKSASPIRASAPEAARVAKLRHAHFLAGVVYRHYIRERAHDSQGAVLSYSTKTQGEFQKALILETAVNLGWPVQSRSELSAVQLAAICGALRKQMDERGIAIPRAHRSSRAKSRDLLDSDPVTQEEQQLILELLGRCLTERDWTQTQAEQFLRRQLHRWKLDWPQTHGQARAIIGGLKAILRREPTAECEPSLGGSK